MRARQAILGHTIRLRRPYPSRRVHVKAPDGLELFALSERGTYDLWVPQAGQWLVTWEREGVFSADDVQVIEVAPESVVESAVITEAATDIDPRSMPPMTVARARRF